MWDKKDSCSGTSKIRTTFYWSLVVIDNSVISQTDESQRDKVFCATAIIDILNETPKINL